MSNKIEARYNHICIIDTFTNNVRGRRALMAFYVCDCGNKKIAQFDDIKTGRVKTCSGCIDGIPFLKEKKEAVKRIPKSLVGLKVNRLLVVSEIENLDKGKRAYLCKCDCGKEKITRHDKLQSRRAISCGCAQTIKRDSSEIKRTSRPEYGIWAGMKARCLSKNSPAFEKYSKRGICEEWVNSFDAFLNDMGERPSKNHSIERRENDKGYSKENCYWATRKEQQNNTSTNIFFTIDGTTKTLAQWIDIYRPTIPYNLIHGRIKRGWDIKDALLIPKKVA